MFQTFNLIATMSAFENVELPMTIDGKLTAKEAKSRAIALLERVGLGDRLEHLVNLFHVCLFVFVCVWRTDETQAIGAVWR